MCLCRGPVEIWTMVTFLCTHYNHPLCAQVNVLPHDRDDMHTSREVTQVSKGGLCSAAPVEIVESDPRGSCLCLAITCGSWI